LGGMSAILNNWEYMLSGLRYTFLLALIGIVGSFLLGCILATLRLSPYLPVRLVNKAFIELI
jgi:putative glutamine transport system permease protein